MSMTYINADMAINNYKNNFIYEKQFYFINDFGDQKDFSPLKRNLTNMSLVKLFPENLTDIFISLNNIYKLELNLGNTYANMLNIYTSYHPLGRFRDNIINQYLEPIDFLIRECPYCFINYHLTFEYNQYRLFYQDEVVDYLDNKHRDYDFCRNCSKEIMIVRNFEHINLYKADLTICGDVESNPGPFNFDKIFKETSHKKYNLIKNRDSKLCSYGFSELLVYHSKNFKIPDTVQEVSDYPCIFCFKCDIDDDDYLSGNDFIGSYMELLEVNTIQNLILKMNEMCECGRDMLQNFIFKLDIKIKDINDIDTSNFQEQTLKENALKAKDFILNIPNILSYEEVMTKLKPVNTITSLYHIYNAPSAADALAEVLRLTETHNLYWSLDSDKLITCIDCLCSLVKSISDVPDLLSHIPGMDRISNLPGTSDFSNMTEQTIKIDEDGFMAKALNFAKEFGVDPDVVTKGGPIVALLSTSVAAIALIGCGSKINNLSLTSGMSHMVHSMAMECKDWKILLSSLKDTWEYIASALGKFLGFTYVDDKTAVRQELISRLESLKKDVEDLENRKELNYTIINDPTYFENFQKRFKDLEKLLIDMIKTDQNLVSFRLVLDKLRTRVQTIKDDYVSLFNSKCGKQQPTTLYIGSELSGIGKTTFMEWLMPKLSEKYGRVLTKYVKGNEDYWSNYVYQDVLHWRDFSQSKTHEEHLELINLYDPSQTQLNMSDNDQKGRQFKSRIMLIDSNMLYIRRSAMIEDGSKLDRRRDFLFEAFTQYEGDSNNPTPRSEEEAIQNLYLVSMPRVKNEGPINNFNTEYFTLDGREISHKSIKIQTQPFSVIVDRIYEHEIANNTKYLEKCQRIFDSERNAQLMGEQTMQPAISQVIAESKKIVILLGDPGTGKTTLARKFSNNRIDGDFNYDEFTLNVQDPRKYILAAYDKGDKDVILTANPTDFEEWMNNMTEDQRLAIERRCLIITCSFAIKRGGYLRGYLTNPTYYTREDVEDPRNASLYARMVSFKVNNGPNIKITGATELITENIKRKTQDILTYDFTPRIKLNKEMARNLVEFDMYWRDVDDISKLSIFDLMKITKVVRSEFSNVQIMKAFGSIVKEVFQNYDLCESLESGLNQLNSLRITAPMEFDCVVKLKDEAFFLTTDDTDKLVFCICDDSFEYKVNDLGKVLCYHEGQFLWEVEGRIASWYKHIQRNVETIEINYTNLTPPSRDLVQYCDYFLNFLKTGFAVLAINKLCTPKANSIKEEMFDVYDQSFTRKPNSYQQETSADSYLKRNPKQERVDLKSKSNFYFVRNETSADAYLDRAQNSPKVNMRNNNNFKFRQETSADAYNYRSNNNSRINTKPSSEFKFKNPVRTKNMISEACMDIQSADLADIVCAQNYPLFINNRRVCYGQGVFGKYMITVGHLAGEVQVEIDNIKYDTEVVAIDNVRDLAIIRVLSKTVGFKDIRKYFQKERLNNSVNGFKATLYCWSERGRNRIYEKPVTLKEQRVMEIKDRKVKDGLLYNVNSLEGNHPIQTREGFCGSPMLICNASYPEKILGLHVAADSIHGLTSVVFQSDLCFEEMESQTMSEESIVVLPFQQVVMEDLPLPEGLKSPLKCVGRAGNIVDGTFVPNKVYSSDKTQIYPSPFSTDDEKVFEPSVLSEKDPRLEVPCENIIYKGINKFANIQKPIDLDILDECVEELSEVLIEAIQRTGMTTKVLNEEEVINGCTYYQTSPSLNMSSGVGYPHSFECGGMSHKADAFYFNLDTCKYEYASNIKGQTIRSDLHSYLDHLKLNGNRTAVLYVAQKKDEVLKLKKISDCGTRIFEMGALYHFMAMKMYYGAAQALLTYVNPTIPFKIGINASSKEYANLYKFLLRTGTNGMNCDYSGFDSSHPYEFLIRYHKIYNNIYKATDPNWSVEDDLIRERLHNNENKPLVLIDEFIIECPGGLMSGGEDTGGKNNICGNLNMRYAWKVLAKEFCPELYFKYDEYTTDATFGDDLIKTIHDDVLSWYNPKNIQRVLSKIGFTITSADKESELDVQPLDELTFLKRTFEDVEVKLGGVTRKYKVGALEDNCFLKMLNWCKCSKRYKYKRSQQIHFDPSTIGLTALTCLQEASLKGKEVFDRTKKHIKDAGNNYNLVLPKLPTFEQAFYETYFGSSFPVHDTIEIINIPYSNVLHPLHPRDFNFSGKQFKSIMHCYEYTRAVCHQQLEKAQEYYDNPTLCKYVYYPNNRRFHPDKLMLKIIKKVFSDYEFDLKENQKYVADYHHLYFGFQIGDAVTNKYGELLTQFAIEKLSKNKLTSENIQNKELNIPDKLNYPISKENIILDSDLFIEPKLRFNTKQWKTAETTLLSQN
jgi:Cdc6-like AAA superfamily ATPase